MVESFESKHLSSHPLNPQILTTKTVAIPLFDKTCILERIEKLNQHFIHEISLILRTLQ